MKRPLSTMDLTTLKRPGVLGRLSVLTLLLTACATGLLTAQIPPDREALLNGEGAGMAQYAESNGFPGPKHVLDLSEQLALTAKQKSDVREIFEDMRTRARSIGKMIVKVEEELHYAFNSGMLKIETVEEDAESIGKMRGTLRGVHLSAHVKTKELLTKKQIDQYVAIRKEQKEKEQKAPAGQHQH